MSHKIAITGPVIKVPRSIITFFSSKVDTINNLRSYADFTTPMFNFYNVDLNGAVDV